ncbi:MAG TPA: ribosome biogenesis GTP-binding protein YihA/YsxC [Gammaproteobacteria bacterium]|nr:ribosome biogenesis GTP-binding protein YihA/YsxC [Gammaproteobacteria bacterium]
MTQVPMVPLVYKLNLNNTTFLQSAPNLLTSPPDKGIEVAFVGRSNAGKSSAINAIVGKNGLARTSKTPGRTQVMNYFTIDDDRRLVDLPGYGYAKVPTRTKQQIEQLLSEYLSDRQCLHGFFMLMDVRLPLTSYDKQLIDFAAQTGKLIHILLTKCDKIKRGAANSTLLSVKKSLSTYEDQLSIQTFSALKNLGIEQAREVLSDWFNFDE